VQTTLFNIKAFVESLGGVNPALILFACVMSAFFLGANAFVFYVYKQTLSGACDSVDKKLLSRTTQIGVAVANLLPKISNNEMQGRYQTKTGLEWSNEAAWWTLVVYWLAKRLEYIEWYAEIEMWQTRRVFFWTNIAGLSLTALIAALSLAGIVQIYSSNAEKFGNAFYLLATLAVVASVVSFVWWNPKIDFIKQNLEITKWGNYKALSIHDKISNQIRIDKRTLVNDLDLIKGN
jgi:hypothetical protein